MQIVVFITIVNGVILCEPGYGTKICDYFVLITFNDI